MVLSRSLCASHTSFISLPEKKMWTLFIVRDFSSLSCPPLSLSFSHSRSLLYFYLLPQIIKWQYGGGAFNRMFSLSRDTFAFRNRNLQLSCQAPRSERTMLESVLRIPTHILPLGWVLKSDGAVHFHDALVRLFWDAAASVYFHACISWMSWSPPPIWFLPLPGEVQHQGQLHNWRGEEGWSTDFSIKRLRGLLQENVPAYDC